MSLTEKQLSHLVSDSLGLEAIQAIVTRDCYTEVSICSSLSTSDMAQAVHLSPLLAMHPRFDEGYVVATDTPLGVHDLLLRLFFLNGRVPVTEAKQSLSHTAIDELVIHEVLSVEGGMLASHVSITPVGESIIFADQTFHRRPRLAWGNENLVMPPHISSLHLLDSLSRQERRDRVVLDIGCGSGVLAVSRSMQGHKAIAIDIDGRALQFTKLNARVNEVEVSVRAGSALLLEDSIGIDEKYSEIVFNTPTGPMVEYLSGGAPSLTIQDCLEAFHSVLRKHGSEELVATLFGTAALTTPRGFFQECVERKFEGLGVVEVVFLDNSPLRLFRQHVEAGCFPPGSPYTTRAGGRSDYWEFLRCSRVLEVIPFLLILRR